MVIATSNDKSGSKKNNVNENSKNMTLYLRGACVATLMYAWMCSCVQEVEDEKMFGQKKANISERNLIDFNVCYLSQERRTDPAS